MTKEEVEEEVELDEAMIEMALKVLMFTRIKRQLRNLEIKG